MLTRLSLFAWLVSLEALDAAPERQDALRAGYYLAALAVGEGLLPDDNQAHGRVARLLAELESDGWVAWDWIRHGGDPRPDQPPATMFDDQALQRVQNIRITPEGYAAFAARQRLSGAGHVEEVDGAPAQPTAARAARYDLFISHASEDKEAVARPLAAALTALGFAVWYDEERIEVGSSLRTSIETGLAASRYGVVVLSRAFFDKPWPQQELNGLFAKEMAVGDDVILPLWHEIDAAFLASRAPMITDRFALNTEIGIAELADRLARRLRREQGRGELRAREIVPSLPPPTEMNAAAPPEIMGKDTANGTHGRERMIAMLRAGDDIGVRELSRFERRAFEDAVLETLREAGDHLGSSAEPELLKPVERALWAQVDRHLGSLLPLLEYRPQVLGEELTALATFTGRATPTRSPYAAWLDGPRWSVWLVTLILGTAAVALNRPEVVVELWRRRAPYDDGRPLPAARLRGGAELGAALLRARPAQATKAVEIWYPAFAVYDSELLRMHYPEIMRGGDTPDAVLGFLSRAGDFLWLCGALAGRDGVEVIRFWSASQVHPTLRTRLGDDAELARAYAEVLDVDPGELTATLDAWIAAVSGPTI